MAILVVDDSPELRELLTGVLQSGGYPDVITAASAHEAFDMLGMLDSRHARPAVDLILMDIMMSGLDGIQACRFIRTDERLREIPILMVTGKPEDQHLQDAFDAGAWDYIRKPIETPILLARVNFAVRLKQETERRRAREQELLETKAQLEEANAMLLKLASLDGLTGIANRRRFDEYLDAEWRRAMRDRRPVGLVMLDIDHFKAYNDAHGHQAGDNCLKLIARALTEALHRPGDQLARYGGEEMAVVLPGTDLEGSLGVGERLRSTVSNLYLPHGGGNVENRVTVSVGVASAVPEISGSADLLVAEADSALYLAKQSGRNCVRHASLSQQSEIAFDVPPGVLFA